MLCAFLAIIIYQVCASSYLAFHKELKVPTLKGIHFHDITSEVRDTIKLSNILEGSVNVLSKHTTTAVTINEYEPRLMDDTRQFLAKLAPSDYPYLHNDIHLRSGPPGWPGGDEAWRLQEPINAHSHLLSMLLGASKTIPIHKGQLCIGQYQSILLVELDGPRIRQVVVQVTGST